jgi:small subunit ribosomal protein S2
MPEDTVLQTQNNQSSGYPAEGSREMMDAGVFYGRKKSKTNPKMRPFVLGNRGGIEIINLEKTEALMDAAAAFIKEKVRNNGLVLVVGTEPAAETTVIALGKKFSVPYVTTRWVGGAVTNFKIISKRVDHLKQLRTDLASGALNKYTKKERLEMEREMRRLEELMGGLENMTREPDVMVIIDPILHHTALAEAITKKIPVVALANVDADPDKIDYLIPGNDKAKKSIEWFLERITKAIEEGIAARATAAAKPEAEVAPIVTK